MLLLDAEVVYTKRCLVDVSLFCIHSVKLKPCFCGLRKRRFTVRKSGILVPRFSHVSVCVVCRSVVVAEPLKLLLFDVSSNQLTVICSFRLKRVVFV